jgi:hypothetical protein
MPDAHQLLTLLVEELKCLDEVLYTLIIFYIDSYSFLFIKISLPRVCLLVAIIMFFLRFDV